jgi:DNA-binding LacI/PurR family transcriptional regulator
VRQPADQVDAKAVGMLFGRLRTDPPGTRADATRSLVLTPRLLVRRSTTAGGGAATLRRRGRNV